MDLDKYFFEENSESGQEEKQKAIRGRPKSEKKIENNELSISESESFSTIVIIGRTLSVKKDKKIIDKYIKNYKVMSIKESEKIFDADYIVSAHPDRLLARKNSSKNKNAITCTGQPLSLFFDYVNQVDKWIENSNSGADEVGCAIKAAIALGFKNIILCGCPLDETEGLQISKTSISDRKQRELHHQQIYLQKDFAEYPDSVSVRSMSGYTMDLFGPPDFYYEELTEQE